MKVSSIVLFAGAALAQSSSNSSNASMAMNPYAPQYGACPSHSIVRNATDLHANETAWLALRRKALNSTYRAYLESANISNFNVTAFFNAVQANSSVLPVLAMAISGGGYDSGYNGASYFYALDARNPNATSARIGGLANSLTYFAGLSGGSTPVTSFAVNNYTSLDQLYKTWNVYTNTFAPSTNITTLTNYYTMMFTDFAAKLEAGFPIGSADLLGRGFAFEFFGTANNGSISTLYSDIAQYDWFKNASWPMPLLGLSEIVDSDPEFQNTGIRIVSANGSLYEFGPLEWGAWNGRAPYFIETKYVGTNMSNGQPVNQTCVTGFDNAGFAIGSSSCATSFWYVQNATNGSYPLFAKRDTLSKRSLQKRGLVFPAAELATIVTPFQQYFNLSLAQIVSAGYPNPFQGLTPGLNTSLLQMVDGSLSGQTIPFMPLLWPARKVDFIIAYDASGETDYIWQNGTNVIDTANYAKQHNIPFPDVPDANTILVNKYNQQPVFFGCNASADVPIVMYVSNAPYTAYTNISFATSGSIPPSEFQSLMQNAFAQASLLNGTMDPLWPQCLACMTVKKSLQRANMTWPQVCQNCVTRYCWNGTKATTNYTLPYNPPLLGGNNQTFVQYNSSIPVPANSTN